MRLTIALLILLTSCATREKAMLSAEGYTGSFQNEPFKKTGESHNYSLLAKFNIYKPIPDTVNISMLGTGEVRIRFRDSSGLRTETFEGRMSHKGYIVIYLTKSRRQIPPLFLSFIAQSR